MSPEPGTIMMTLGLADSDKWQGCGPGGWVAVDRCLTLVVPTWYHGPTTSLLYPVYCYLYTGSTTTTALSSHTLHSVPVSLKFYINQVK